MQKIFLSFARLIIVSFRADKKLVVSTHKLQKNVRDSKTGALSAVV